MEEAEHALSPDEPDQADTADRTRVWRLDQFIDLGFDVVPASLMADDSRVDLAFCDRRRSSRGSVRSRRERVALPPNRDKPKGVTPRAVPRATCGRALRLLVSRLEEDGQGGRESV